MVDQGVAVKDENETTVSYPRSISQIASAATKIECLAGMCWHRHHLVLTHISQLCQVHVVLPTLPASIGINLPLLVDWRCSSFLFVDNDHQCRHGNKLLTHLCVVCKFPDQSGVL